MMRRFLVFILPILWISSCTHRMIVVESSPDASISLVNPGSLDGAGELLGTGKAELKLKQIGNRFIKISAPNKFSQILVVTDTLGVMTKMNIKLNDIPDKSSDNSSKPEQGSNEDSSKNKEDKNNSIKDQNLLSRILLRSYQALTKGNFKQANELALEMSKISPRLAAPHIIVGLSNLKEGNKQAAVTAFTKAKSLDPEDSDIEKLLEISK